MIGRVKIRLLVLSGLAAGISACYVFLSATATASGRFSYCGPSSLDHPDPSCRVAYELLIASFGLAAVAILLVVAATWLFLRRRKAG